jgi:hypothetical protein
MPSQQPLWVPAPGHTRETCVILTLDGHFLTVRSRFEPLSPGWENQRSENAALDMWAVTMEKESTPLWVWLSAGLLVICAVTYVTTVYLIEYVLTLF